ncbi:EamA family transporter [Enterococcus faecalis]|nr:EamA family transporter [Enterococcus faecalis]
MMMEKINKNSKHNMKLAIILILIATACSTFGQMVWKIGTERQGGGSMWEYALGLVLSGISLVFMMLSFRYGEVSILQPMMSLGFCLSMVLGHFFLHESISISKIIGVVFIVLGAFLLGKEGGKSHG